MSLKTARHRLGWRPRPEGRWYPVDLLLRAGRRFVRMQGVTQAAALAYFVFFSLFPLLIFLLVVFGLFLRDPSVQARVIEAILAQVPPGINVRPIVEHLVQEAAMPSGGIVGLVSLVIVAWSASAVFAALRRSLNTAFGVPATRSFVRGRVRDLLAVLAVTPLLLLWIGATTALGLARSAVSDYVTGGTVNLAWTLVFALLPVVSSFIVFLLAYRFIPNQRLSLRQLWLGALIAALGFELGKAGFGFYVTHIANYNRLYGTLGGVVAFMIFVFLAATLIIFSAALTAELARSRAAGPPGHAAPDHDTAPLLTRPARERDHA